MIVSTSRKPGLRSLVGLLAALLTSAQAVPTARAQATPGGSAPAAASPTQARDEAKTGATDTLVALDADGKPKRQFALFRTASLDPKLQELGAALDPVVLSELNTIGTIEVTARPSLDLPAMQLAIDCVGEIGVCMAAVAREAGVEALVAPVLRSDGDQVLVTLLYFDIHENQIRGVTRQLQGRSVAQAMLDAVPEMVREAFGLPPVSTAEPGTGATDQATPSAEPPERSRAARVVPWVLAGTGVTMLAVGLGLSISANNAENSYANTAIDDSSDVDLALDRLDTAQRRALAANVSFGVGGAALVASLATWLWFRHEQNEPPKVALLPRLSHNHVGLSVEGILGR
jgi:hypothetical protein